MLGEGALPRYKDTVSVFYSLSWRGGGALGEGGLSILDEFTQILSCFLSFVSFLFPQSLKFLVWFRSFLQSRHKFFNVIKTMIQQLLKDKRDKIYQSEIKEYKTSFIIHKYFKK